MNLTDQELILLSKLLNDALDLPEETQETWLSSLGEPESKLRDTLRALLAERAAIETNDFLNTLPPLVPAQAPATSEGGPIGLQAGAAIGSYELVRVLGSGGMGMVWLAIGKEGSLKRPVALKLPFSAVHTEILAERFARERDILAGLEHPNIARLYDAGITATGQPYLALEYVDGVPLTDFCDAQQLPIRRRLDPFLQVLAAVQYAHSHLVIHRDLKPSNILVTVEGQVMLLDFGVAKLMVAGEAKETELTLQGGRALTLDYASPEQIVGQPLSTASDVYALGVVLYELLTGARPYKLKRDSRGALEEAVLSAEAPAPSQAVRGDEQARARGATSRKLAKELAGDLDTITLKALKKSPADRYQNAADLADDLGRYLRGEAVRARPDSTWYRSQKFVARHKLGVGSVVAVVVALAAGLSAFAWQARIARIEAHRAQTVQQFLLDIFQANGIDQDDPAKGRHTTAQELLDTGAKRVNEQLKDSPEAQEQVLSTLADMYVQIGLPDEAANLRLQRIAVLKKLYGPTDARVADALLSYASDLTTSADRTPILVALKEAEHILDVRHDSSSPIRGVLMAELASYYRYTDLSQSRRYSDAAVAFFQKRDAEGNLGEALRLAGKSRDLLGHYAEALRWHQAAIEEIQSRHPGIGGEIVEPLWELGGTQASLLDIAGAEKNLRSSMELARKSMGGDNYMTLLAQLELGRFLYETSRRQEGRALIQNTLDTVNRPGAKTAPGFLPQIAGEYGVMLLRDGRPGEAEQYLAMDMDDLRKNYAGSSSLARDLLSQGQLYIDLGRYADADKTLREAREIWHTTAGAEADPAMDNRYLLQQAKLSLAMGNPGLAIDQLRGLSRPADASRLPLLLDDISGRVELARAYLQQNRTAEARDLAGAALASVQHSPLRGFFQSLEADAALWLGEAQRRIGEFPAARENLERALSLREANDAQTSPWIAEAQVALANCFLASGHPDQARGLLSKAQAIDRAGKELGDQFEKPIRELQVRLAVVTAEPGKRGVAKDSAEVRVGWKAAPDH